MAASGSKWVGTLPRRKGFPLVALDFAPVILPTLRTGVEVMVAAAGAWLCASAVSAG
jgi:hypothetical protein